MLEVFRLRVRHEPKAGPIWELHLLPNAGANSFYKHARLLGSASASYSVPWLRELAGRYLKKGNPKTILEDLGPDKAPVILNHEEGMRLALAFSCARYLGKAEQRKVFAQRLDEMAPEVLLYWFTLCYYGNRTAAARAALRELLLHEGDEVVRPARSVNNSPRSRQRPDNASKVIMQEGEGTLFYEPEI